MLSQLHSALKDLHAPSLHPWVKRAGRGKVYVVEINESGFPISVRLRTSSEPLWCIYKSAENIFPVIKTKPKPNRDYETVINTAIGNCVRFAKQLSLFETAAAMGNIEPGIWYEKFKEIWEDAKEQGILADNDDYRKGYLLISRGHEYTPYEYNAIVSSVSVDGKLGVCSLTGQHGLIETHTFPSPNLPGLGNTYLFAKNEDIPCFKRYAPNGAGSISVSKQALTELSGKLAALTQNQWRGKTWAQLKINGHNALLLAHTDTDTTDFAELLASDDELYPIVCQKVLSALSAHHKTGANPSLVKILCLRVLDTGTRGVEFEREIDSAVLLSNLKTMLAVVRNAPVFAGFRRDTLKLLSPYSISLLLEHQYRSDGGKTVVHSNHFETCFELLTGDAQEAAEKLLSVALQRLTTLLVDGSHTTDYKNGISVLYVLRGGLMDTTALISLL